MAQSSPRAFGVRYEVFERADRAWDLSEETLPESVPHLEAVDLLYALLSFWASSRPGDAFVGRNLAVRWNEQRPSVGVDPDVSLFRPAPPDARNLTSVRTWVAGHAPPVLGIEVVSNTNPRKDSTIAPDKYAASGTGELWVFDPLLAGPASQGGPHRLQLWTRRADGDLVRTYTGEGPVFSPVLQAWLVVTEEGRKLRIATAADAAQLWLTGEESERAAKEAALAKLAELERRLLQT